MKTGGLEANGFAIEKDRLLFVVDGTLTDVFKVRDFLFQQAEVVEFEYNQQKFKKPANAGGNAKKAAAAAEAAKKKSGPKSAPKKEEAAAAAKKKAEEIRKQKPKPDRAEKAEL